MEFETKAIHSGEERTSDDGINAITPPIHLTSTFLRKDIGSLLDGYAYSRLSNPTRTILEKKLADLEGGRFCLCFSSGMAAETVLIMSLVKTGDHIIASDDLYGGTKELLSMLFAESFGVKVTYVDATSTRDIEKAITKNTKLIWLETPSNPLMKLCDIKRISVISKKYRVKLIVDNTFASPFLQKPLLLGADAVVHSTTKYLNGHSDSIGGAVITSDKELYEKMNFVRKIDGAILSPFDSFLVARGVKTLAIRMRQHEENAMKIAEYLEKQKKVKRVIYPGLKSHPQYELAKKQMSGFGGMLSFELYGGLTEVRRFLSGLKIISLAVSLGGIESLIEHPSSMTHGVAQGKNIGNNDISESLLRLSVGIERVEDLIADIASGLKKIQD